VGEGVVDRDGCLRRVEGERRGGGRETPKVIRDADELNLIERRAPRGDRRRAASVEQRCDASLGGGGVVVRQCLTEKTIAGSDDVSGAPDPLFANPTQ
jgi:hypothetical protein